MLDWIKKANELNQKNISFIIATIIENSGSTPRDSGAKMIIKPDGSFDGTIGGGFLENKVLEDSKEIFSQEKSTTIEYFLTPDEGSLCGGKARVFFELVGSFPELYIFGAGHVGQALCSVMKNTPFKINIIDDREPWIYSEKIPSSVIRHKEKYLNFIDKINFNSDKTYIVVMTPGHSQDKEVVEGVLRSKFKYLGLMGSISKWTEIKESLKEQGFNDEEINLVKCPIGIPIGGKSPAEISISIGAELIKVYYGNK